MKTPPTPLFLIAAANAFVGLDLAATNGVTGVLGSFMSEVNAFPYGNSQTWDAAFVHHVGYWGHYNDFHGGSSWPLPPVATAEALADFARVNDLIACEPEPGDVFLLWNPARETFVRTGVIVRLEWPNAELDRATDRRCVVIEGDTNPERALGGGFVLRHVRVFSEQRGDRFIRWTEARRTFDRPSRRAA